MAYDRQLSVNEMKRNLKPDGQVYMSLGAGPPFGYVDKAEWEKILEGLIVQRGGSYKEKWAVVDLKQEPLTPGGKYELVCLSGQSPIGGGYMTYFIA